MKLPNISREKIIYINVIITAIVTSLVTTFFLFRILSKQTVTPQVDVISAAQNSYQPIADTHVKQGYPDKNYGSVQELITSSYESTNIRRSFLKFNLSGIAGQNITKASLKLTANLERTVSKEIKIVSDSGWSENDINWNNQPGQGATLGKIENQKVAVGTQVTFDLDVNQLQPYAGTNVTLSIDNSSGENTFSVYSKEAASGKPELLIETDGISTVTPPTLSSSTPTASATPSQTKTPTPKPSTTSTSTPTIVPTPTPSDGSGISLSNSYGIYPNCIAPAIGIEDHSWWWQPGEEFPRHVHIAACAPNSRDNNGNYVWVNGDVPLTLRIMMFNNPGKLTWVRGGYVPNGSLAFEGTDCPGAEFCKTFSTPLRCQARPDERKECTWFIDINFRTDPSVSGLKELRLSPNVIHDDLGGKRQFATLNFQMYLKGNGSPSNYRSGPSPIIRSWYTDFDYANFTWKNYINLLGSDTRKNIPTLSGVVPMTVDHARGSHTQFSKLFIDPNFHANPTFHLNAVVGQTAPDGSQLLYEKGGLFEGTFNFDTTKFANGLHNLYFQTEDREGSGSTFGGMNAGAMKVTINIQN